MLKAAAFPCWYMTSRDKNFLCTFARNNTDGANLFILSFSCIECLKLVGGVIDKETTYYHPSFLSFFFSFLQPRVNVFPKHIINRVASSFPFLQPHTLEFFFFLGGGDLLCHPHDSVSWVPPWMPILKNSHNLDADTTPPKQRIKDASVDLYSAGFAPGAIVYFSYDMPKGALYSFKLGLSGGLIPSLISLWIYISLSLSHSLLAVNDHGKRASPVYDSLTLCRRRRRGEIGAVPPRGHPLSGRCGSRLWEGRTRGRAPRCRGATPCRRSGAAEARREEAGQAQVVQDVKKPRRVGKPSPLSRRTVHVSVAPQIGPSLHLGLKTSGSGRLRLITLEFAFIFYVNAFLYIDR